MRVLFVNADPSVAQAISLMLKPSGIVIDHTCSGPEALKLTQRRDYDVILLDLAARDIGFEALDLLHHACAAPVLALGACHKGQERLRALDCGAAGYLARPFERTELIECLRAITGHSQIHKSNAPDSPMLRRSQVARTGAFGSPPLSSAAWD